MRRFVTFLTRGAQALVVISKNPETAGCIVESAREKNVPVMAYDRLIRNGDVDIYVAFDDERGHLILSNDEIAMTQRKMHLVTTSGRGAGGRSR